MESTMGMGSNVKIWEITKIDFRIPKIYVQGFKSNSPQEQAADKYSEKYRSMTYDETVGKSYMYKMTIIV